MIELGISRTRPATEVRSGEHSYTDLVLAGLLAQQGRARRRLSGRPGPFNRRRGCGRAVCQSPRPISSPSLLRYWAQSGGTLPS